MPATQHIITARQDKKPQRETSRFFAIVPEPGFRALGQPGKGASHAGRTGAGAIERQLIDTLLGEVAADIRTIGFQLRRVGGYRDGFLRGTYLLDDVDARGLVNVDADSVLNIFGEAGGRDGQFIRGGGQLGS